MNHMIGCCGLNCAECPAYLATVKDDDAMRRETAEKWSKMYGAEIKPEHIHCKGCRSDVLFSHCTVCEIRKCSLDNELDNCGECDCYGCDKVSDFFKLAPEAKDNLDKIRNK